VVLYENRENTNNSLERQKHIRGILGDLHDRRRRSPYTTLQPDSFDNAGSLSTVSKESGRGANRQCDCTRESSERPRVFGFGVGFKKTFAFAGSGA